MTHEKIFDLKKLLLIADLIYFEGPILSLLTDSKGNLFIYKWCGLDAENNAHKWLIFSISFENLEKYIEKKIPLCQLIEEALIGLFEENNYLLVSIKQCLEYLNLHFFNKSTLPIEYKSTNDSFFDEDYCEDSNQLDKFMNRNRIKINKLPNIQFNSFTKKDKLYLPNTISHNSKIMHYVR